MRLLEPSWFADGILLCTYYCGYLLTESRLADQAFDMLLR